MYSSVSVGVVHVLCACAHVQSTVWCSCHSGACNHLTTHLFVAFLCLCLLTTSCCCCSTCSAACCPLFLNPWKSSYLFPIQSSSAPTIPSHHLRLITIGKLNMWGYLVLQLRCFLPRVLTMFLCQCLAKHWYLRSFHQVVRCSFYMRKG